MQETETTSEELEIQEVANPQVEAAQEEQHEEVQAETKKDRSWRELRRQKDEWEKEARVQKELVQRLVNQQQMPQQQVLPEEDIISSLAKEDYVAGEKVAKAYKSLEASFDRRLQELDRKYAAQQQSNSLQDLKRRFPDFDQVVNSETLNLLEETDPELATAIASTKDPYMVAVQSYKYIKAAGLAPKQPSKRAKEVEAKIEQNKKTIQSPAAYEKRPLAAAFKMTKEQEKELQSEMYHFAQQVGMGY